VSSPFAVCQKIFNFHHGRKSFHPSRNFYHGKSGKAGKVRHSYWVFELVKILLKADGENEKIAMTSLSSPPPWSEIPVRLISKQT
jgi:hypothetical protein